ncbi:MAG: PLP-dependent aminotransferase family protein [Thermoproteota archaeon]
MEYERYISSYARSVKASEIRELLKVVEKGQVISLAGGLPDPATFPREEIAEIASYVIRELGDKALQYSPTKGVAPFLEAVREFSVRHGVKVAEDDDIIATVGSQQSLYLLALALLDPGDFVVAEEPTYLGMIQAFKARGAGFVTVPLDEQGMQTHAAEERIKRAISEGKRVKLIYTVPTCHNPAGTTMPEDRRRHLLELASRYDLLVIEDDPYSFVTFEGERPPSLKTLDSEGRVIYISSLSKILSPGLRLGWIIAPSQLVRRVELVKQAVDLHTPTLTQYIASEAIKRGVIDRNIPKIREVYRAKRDAMLQSLEENLAEYARWTKPVGGLFVWLWFNESINSRKLLDIAIRRGVAFVPGSAFYPLGGGENTARLNYSYPAPEQIREGIRRLAEAVREYLAL